MVCWFFPAAAQCCVLFALLLSLSLSAPLWQDGMVKAVVYPGKLPIVSAGNSLWETAPREQESAQRMELNAELLVVQQQWGSRGSGARGKMVIPRDCERWGD